MELLLNHLKHPHPLVLSEEKYDNTSRCSVCHDFVAGLCYCCKNCVFVMHKWCAELPLEVTNHPLHPDHPRLVLLSAQQRSDGSVSDICQDCKTDISSACYVFSCVECSFLLHFDCALLPKQVEFEFDDANSLPARKKLTFKKKSSAWRCCYVCKGGMEKSMFEEAPYFCFHIQCAMLPKTVKHDRHLHGLTLHVNIEKEKRYHGCYCDLCEEERDPDQWLYYCSACEVVGHLRCGLLGKDHQHVKNILTSNPIYTVEREKKKVEDGEQSMTTVPGTPIRSVILEQKPLGEIVHFSHSHPLFLYSDVWDRQYICVACGVRVYGKMYICSGCKFYLHKWCAELPQEVHFGFHLEHPLTLLSYHTLACSYCRSGNEHFSFSCLECDFGFHTICAFLSEYKQHKHHAHPLKPMVFNHRLLCRNIPVRSRPTTPCNACLFPCMDMSLGCDECCFYLHVGCSLYPPTGKAKTHMHNLELTYDFQEEPGYDEFICDACEKSRTPGCWVYCCPYPKCEFVSHLDCAVPIVFAAASSSGQENLKHEDDNIACCCDACEKERDPNDWIYYRPSPSLHLLNGLQTPEIDWPIQRILKSDPVYAFLRASVLLRNVPKVEMLQHFSHPHPLVLCNEEWNCEIKCKACNRSIYGKTYICRECGYYLHKWCAQIPQQMHFKFHPQHSLTILPAHDFECCVCDVQGFGFSFSCQICDLEAHTLCALMPGRVLASHEHCAIDVIFYTTPRDLITTCRFPVKINAKPLCNACQFPCEGITIRCKWFGLNLHIGCAWYPRTSDTNAHRHTLTLENYSSGFKENVYPIVSRHFCDVCDKALTPSCWGYLCTESECNLTAAHLDCAVPNPFLTSSFESILVHQV